MFGILIALAASIGWGTSDFGGGFFSRRHPVPTVVFTFELAGLVCGLLLVAIFQPALPSSSQVLAGIAAGTSGITGLALFYWAMARGSMTIVAPISAVGAALPVIYGIARGDEITVLVGVGLLLAFAGVVLVSQQHHEGAVSLKHHKQSVVVALAAACLFGLYFILMEKASGGPALWTGVFARVIAVPASGLIVLLWKLPLSAGKDMRGLVAVGCIDFGATLLYAFANQHANLVIVAVVGSLFPVTTVVLARWLLKEQLGRVQLVGIIAALGGVALISFGAA